MHVHHVCGGQRTSFCLPVQGLVISATEVHTLVFRLPCNFLSPCLAKEYYRMGSENGAQIWVIRLLPTKPSPWTKNICLKMSISLFKTCLSVVLVTQGFKKWFQVWESTIVPQALVRKMFSVLG